MRFANRHARRVPRALFLLGNVPALDALNCGPAARLALRGVIPESGMSLDRPLSLATRPSPTLRSEMLDDVCDWSGAEQAVSGTCRIPALRARDE